MTPLAYLRIGGAAAVLALIAFLWLGWDHASSRADRLATEVREQTARADAAERRETVLKQAEAERAMDASQLDTMKDDLTHAIQSAPAGAAPGPASVAAGCSRLRRAGLTASPEYRRICG